MEVVLIILAVNVAVLLFSFSTYVFMLVWKETSTHNRLLSSVSTEGNNTNTGVFNYDDIPSVKSFDVRMEMLKEELAGNYVNNNESVAYVEKGIYNIPSEEMDAYLKRKMYEEDEVGL